MPQEPLLPAWGGLETGSDIDGLYGHWRLKPGIEELRRGQDSVLDWITFDYSTIGSVT
jgi:hypothetical protein